MFKEKIYLTDDKVAWLDCYVLDGNAKRDAMLIIPGGGYSGVSHFLEGEPIAVAFLEKGYNCFVLNYHVGKGQNYPTQLIDASLAMLYIKNNCEKYMINPSRVFAVGFSAGGHLTAALSTMIDYPEIKERFGEDCARIRPTASILSYPVTTAGEYAHKGSFEYLLGKPYNEISKDEIYRQSPENALDEKTPPIFIWHTAEDDCVPVIGSIRFAAAMSKNKRPFKLSIYPYGPHALGDAREGKTHRYPWVNEAADWLKTI